MNMFDFNNSTGFVKEVDSAFYFILVIDIFFLILITALMVYFVIRYHKKRNQKAEQVEDKTWLEVTWTVIPLILVLFMFYIGWKNYLPMRKPPKDAIEIKVIGSMWNWQFEYPNGKISNNDLYVPINKPVKLNLYSPDVLHGFFVPAFRVKEDIVPGKNNYTWFKATELGDYDLFCSVYCGVRHAYMTGFVKVVTTDEFNEIMANLPDKAAQLADGEAILKNNGCFSCHSMDGTRLVGPTFKGLWGSKKTIIDANGVKKTITVDEAYIKESIIDPDKELVEGFNKGMMRSYKGVLKDEEIQAIIDYFKSKQEK